MDLNELKAGMKATWNAGDYDGFARYMEPGAADLVDAWGVEPGQRLLDVACGAGQVAICAARKGITVTGCDIAPNWVEAARRRAAEESLDATFDEADAEALPYEDDSFDVVTSLFGAMFAPRPEKVAAELLRVVRPGGRIWMGNWTPDSFPAAMFRTVASYVPPAADVPSPVLWGDEATVQVRLAGASEVRVQKRLYSKWMYPFPVRDVLDFFCANFGPLVRGLPQLDAEQQAALREDLLSVFDAYNRGTEDLTMLEGQFLNVEAVR
jgi:SAM-dependent methyltransferase